MLNLFFSPLLSPSQRHITKAEQRFLLHSLYLPANAGRSTTERRPACGRVSSHMRSYLVPRSLTSKESVVFLLRLRCNRLLRRQHCSSLCLQSEGHEHVANIASALGHFFVGFLAVFGRHNIPSPHFASKVSYSASPQTFAECSRSASCCCAASALLLGQKPRRVFLDFEHPIRQFPTSCNLLELLQALIEVIDSRPRIVLLAAASNATVGREQRYHRPRIDNLSRFSGSFQLKNICFNGCCYSHVL